MFSWLRPKTQRKVALVIGNSDYDNVTDLPNATVDATRIADTLERLGFTVIFRIDLSYDDLVHACELFTAELRSGLSPGEVADVACLYYAGHGVQIEGENYLIPVDYHPGSWRAGGAGGVGAPFRVQNIMGAMAPLAEKNLIFLDACRDRGGIDPELLDANDAQSGAKLTSGLAKFELHPDELTFVAFAADPGDVAKDGYPGEGSPFSNALARHMVVPNVDLNRVMQRVANVVRTETGGEQRPWAYSNMSEAFCLVPKDWRPVFWLGGLGFLIGVLNAYFGYDNQGYPHSLAAHPEALLTSALFAATLAFGVYRWGSGTLMGALIAFVIYAAVTVACRVWVDSYVWPLAYGFTEADTKIIGSLANAESGFTKTPQVREFVLILILAGGLVGAFSVIGGALSSRALRPVHRAATGILIGAIAAGMYVLFVAFQSWIRERSGGVMESETLRLAGIYVTTGLWQAALGINVGWAFTHYQGEPDG